MSPNLTVAHTYIDITYMLKAGLLQCYVASRQQSNTFDLNAYFNCFGPAVSGSMLNFT